ncbi:peptidoglycan-binding protein [Streptomyces sp. NPDC127190]|uniref:peptidoglycan-binding domain-containing protein n=1 Tax=unclassified Streptomyces TaxID=2593676 RepID=UPI0036413FEE
MAISATRTSIGIGIATLALLGGTAGGVASAATARPATAAHTASAGTAASHKCVYKNGFGFSCGYYKGHATVKYGSKGNAVREVQAIINQTTAYKPKLTVDGDFGSKTKKAVIWFQQTFHVKPYDGIVGAKTWKELRLK